MSKVRYVVQWDEQPVHLSKILCTLLESQTLVDLTVNCNSYTIKVHKCILAANSTYFRDHLQKDMSIDRVVINSIKQIVLKSLIEYMYCGETSIPEENMDELITAAKFFSIRGLSSIIPQKLGGDHGSGVPDCNLMNKPPLFFSKNDKKYSFKDKDHALYDMDRRKHSHSKVTDEARVALAKEEAASRFALEMLKKDMNNTSNVFVIDETCTEATVETNLTAQYENTNNMMQIQDYVLQNEIKSDNSELVDEQNNIDISNMLAKTKQSPREERIHELTENVPMVYKPNENTYVNVNVSSQILETLQNTHAITYHVMPEETNVDFQQYICGNFGHYPLQIEAPQSQSSYEIIDDVQSEIKKPLTFTQLVADTVSSEFDSSYTENTVTYDSVITKTEENIQYVTSEIAPPKLVPEEIFASNYNENMGADSVNMRSKDIPNENMINPKKKRGRPPKRKLLEKNFENESILVSDQKSTKFENDCGTSDIVEQVIDTVIVDLNNEDEKENQNPGVNDSEINIDSNGVESLWARNAENESNFTSYENRRQTRSSYKFR